MSLFPNIASNKSLLSKSLSLLSMLSVGLLFSVNATANVTSGLGTFTLDGGNTVTATSASGSYTTANGDTGRFTISQDLSEGYGGAPTYQGGNNGLQVSNASSTVGNDRFRYTLSLIPSNSKTINTIKIAQTSYDGNSSRNSEVAKQTLTYTPNTQTTASSRAYIANNPSVPLLYNAMGDYFMGSRTSTNPNRFQTNENLSQPQLRIDSSDTPIYYYKFEYLLANPTTNPTGYNLVVGPDGLVTKESNYGFLPPSPTLANIIKSTSTNPNNQNTYQALNEGTTIPNGGSYVSYGVTNSDTQYVVDAYDVSSVTLDYKGIMLGSSAISNPNSDEPKTGETIREWITFGVASSTPPDIIPAPPNSTPVTCPVGTIADTFVLADYQALAATNGALVNITGKNNESYIQAKLTQVASNVSNTSLTSLVNNAYNQPYFRYTQDPNNQSGNTVFTYEFINKFNSSPQELSQLTLSLFDIDAYDYRLSRGYEVQDQVKIVGFNGTTGPLNPTKKDQGSYVKGTSPTYYTPSTSSFGQNECANGNFDGNCQVTVKFDQPVTKVQITFNNYPESLVGNPDPQDFETVISGYCYKPQPRIIYNKKLDGARINDTDQFKVQIKDLTAAGQPIVTDAIPSTTTQGQGSSIISTTGTTGTFKVNPTHTYSLIEAGVGTTDLANYAKSYTCSKTTIVNGATTTTTVNNLNPNSLQFDYGEEWSCSVTNKKANYTISGKVFNDNGGITTPTADGISGYVNNSYYFNGVLDSKEAGEAGIPFTPGHSITLAKCEKDTSSSIFTPKTININADGFYQFDLTAAEKGTNSKLCVTQNEPENYKYSVDTTSNVREITFDPKIYDYPGNDFGDVLPINTALVLQKRQYITDCDTMRSKQLNDTSLNTQDVTSTGEDTVFPREGFSKNDPKTTDNQGNPIIVAPGLCIAYKITAINRGHVKLTDVKISDELQTTPVISYYLMSPATITPDNVGVKSAPADKTNGTIITNGFDLPAPTTTPITKSLYFNTRYGEAR